MSSLEYKIYRVKTHDNSVINLKSDKLRSCIILEEVKGLNYDFDKSRIYRVSSQVKPLPSIKKNSKDCITKIVN